MPIQPCPGCKIDLEIPPKTPSETRIRCPECSQINPLSRFKPPASRKPIAAMEIIEDEEDKPRRKKRPSQQIEVIEDDVEESPKTKPKRKKKKKRKVQQEEVPFWKTRTGMLLNGLGMIGLGGAALAIAYFGEPRRQMTLYIAGGLCLLGGLGAVGNGINGTMDDSESSDF